MSNKDSPVAAANAGDGRRIVSVVRKRLVVASLLVVGIMLVVVRIPPISHPSTGDATAQREASRPGQSADALVTPGATDPDSASVAPLWSPVDEGDVDRLPRYAPGWSPEGRVLVRVTEAARAAGGWQVGDRVTLPLPQLGVVHRSAIEKLRIGPGPSVSALGMVLGDDGRRRRFVVTVGPAHVFAYIDTRRGPYELTGDAELGWLLPSSSMMAGFDFSKPDYVLPGAGGSP